VAEQPHVTTAAELDAMTPAERRRHFEDSVVDPATLSEQERARLVERGNRMIADYEARKSRHAS
jgi:hypothetical protein